MIESCPLTWPDGFARTKTPERSRFNTDRRGSVTLTRARRDLEWEIGHLGGTKLIISSNMPTRQDGGVYSRSREPEDSGVAVWFTLDGQPRVLACDRWDRCVDNTWALAKTVWAMRGIDRWGCSEVLARVFTGFVGIPEDAGKDWRSVLGVDGAEVTPETLRAAFRRRMKEAHPDAGGSEEEAVSVQDAYDQARRELEAHHA